MIVRYWGENILDTDERDNERERSKGSKYMLGVIAVDEVFRRLLSGFIKTNLCNVEKLNIQQ